MKKTSLFLSARGKGKAEAATLEQAVVSREVLSEIVERNPREFVHDAQRHTVVVGGKVDALAVPCDFPASRAIIDGNPITGLPDLSSKDVENVEEPSSSAVTFSWPIFGPDYALNDEDLPAFDLNGEMVSQTQINDAGLQSNVFSMRHLGILLRSTAAAQKMLSLRCLYMVFRSAGDFSVSVQNRILDQVHRYNVIQLVCMSSQDGSKTVVSLALKILHAMLGPEMYTSRCRRRILLFHRPGSSLTVLSHSKGLPHFEEIYETQDLKEPLFQRIAIALVSSGAIKSLSSRLASNFFAESDSSLIIDILDVLSFRSYEVRKHIEENAQLLSHLYTKYIKTIVFPKVQQPFEGLLTSTFGIFVDLMLFSKDFARTNLAMSVKESALQWLTADSLPLPQSLAFRFIEMSAECETDLFDALVDYRMLILNPAILYPENTSDPGSTIDYVGKTRLRASAAWNFISSAFFNLKEHPTEEEEIIASLLTIVKIASRGYTTNLDETSVLVVSAILRFLSSVIESVGLDKREDECNLLLALIGAVKRFIKVNQSAIDSTLHHLLLGGNSDVLFEMAELSSDFVTFEAACLFLSTSVPLNLKIGDIKEDALKLLNGALEIIKIPDHKPRTRRACTFGLHEFLWSTLFNPAFKLNHRDCYNLNLLFLLTAPSHYLQAQILVCDRVLLNLRFLEGSDESVGKGTDFASFLSLYRDLVKENLELHAMYFPSTALVGCLYRPHGRKSEGSRLTDMTDWYRNFVRLFFDFERQIYSGLKPTLSARLASLYDLALSIDIDEVECFPNLFRLMYEDCSMRGSIKASELPIFTAAFQRLTAEFVATGKPSLALLATIALTSRFPKDFRKQWWEETQQIILRTPVSAKDLPFSLDEMVQPHEDGENQISLYLQTLAASDPRISVNAFFCIAFLSVREYLRGVGGMGGSQLSVPQLAEWSERVDEALR
ncbi:hypothetical protein HDU67_002833 [Dinochytrium kinnereticum]|nr:hypothetical protein HDU67_002833 [Dinochytrium kinnereticum]